MHNQTGPNNYQFFSYFKGKKSCTYYPRYPWWQTQLHSSFPFNRFLGINQYVTFLF